MFPRLLLGFPRFCCFCMVFQVFVFYLQIIQCFCSFDCICFCGFDCVCEKLSTNTENQKPRPHGHPFCNFWRPASVASSFVLRGNPNSKLFGRKNTYSIYIYTLICLNAHIKYIMKQNNFCIDPKQFQHQFLASTPRAPASVVTFGNGTQKTVRKQCNGS